MKNYLPLTQHIRQVLFENELTYRFSGQGTCFLLQFNNRFFAITAKHVINKYSSQQIRIIINPKSASKMKCCFEIEQPFCYKSDDSIVQEFEDFVVIPIDGNDLNQTERELFFLYRPVNDSCFCSTNTNPLIIAGFPDDNQNIDYEKQQIEGQAMILLGKQIETRDNDLTYKLSVKHDAKLSTFSGFSGSPVFSCSANGNNKIIGMVLRGHPENKIFRFLDIRAIITGIDVFYKNNIIQPTENVD